MKKLIAVIIVLLLLVYSSSFFKKSHATEDTKNIKEEQKEPQYSNLFTIMLENKKDKYVEQESSSWPDSGYIFNSEKSGCDNTKGEYIKEAVIYKQKEKIALVNIDNPVKCYLYFDKE